MTKLPLNESLGDNSKPFISIITIAYNVEEYIEDCIKSVVSQDYRSLEYIIIDGGSSDKTANIIESYEQKLAYWHSKPDRGLTHAFNLGLEKCNGDWVLFLNSDDFLIDDTVLSEISLQLQENPDADVVLGQTVLVDRVKAPEKKGKVLGGPFIWREFILKDTIPHPSAFTNKSFFTKYGVFREEFKVAMDYELFLRSGKSIRLHFTPTRVSGMRNGGVSQAHGAVALREWRKAHRLHGWLPFLWIDILYIYLRIKLYIYLAVSTLFNSRERNA